MLNPACPYCTQNHYVIKSGRNRALTQRYRCQSCQRYFTPEPKVAGYDLDLRRKAVQLYLEGASYRAIARVLGVHNQTVNNWISAYQTSLAEVDYNEAQPCGSAG